MFKSNGFQIFKEKKIQIEKVEAEKFYKVHETKPFYNDLCEYLSSGPIVVMILQKENAVKGNRELMGATNPKDAEEGTIRKKYGISIDKNSVHGSDSIDNAKIEIDYFFQFDDVFSDFGSFEVSSPGLDRRLFNLQQCKNFVGDVVSLTLFSKVNGQRKIKGALQEVLDSEISVKTEKGELLLDFSNIEKCKLDLDFQLGKKK